MSAVKKLLLSFLALVCFAASASAGLKIYYLRHAESGTNVESAWKDTPRDQWPPYVGNEDAFSPLGEKQAAAVPEKLAGYKFDFIAVSPKWRARQTILGFLRKNNARGEIWPELEEFGCALPSAQELKTADTLPAARPDLFSGSTIRLPAEEGAFFTLRKDGKKGFRLRHGVSETIEDGVNALRRAIAMIGQRKSHGDQSILLVGHSISGRFLLRMLVKREGDLPKIDNTGLWMAEEQPDGSFKLNIFNDRPVGRHAPLHSPAEASRRDSPRLSPRA